VRKAGLGATCSPAMIGPAGAFTEGAANRLTANLAAGALLLSAACVLLYPLLCSAAVAGRRSRKVLLLKSGVLLGDAVSVRQTCGQGMA
jgi:hypothetical protein